jgi:4-oxalocrotonate tautomerase
VFIQEISMPVVNIKMTPATAKQKAILIREVTRLMVDLLDKDPAKTHVVIEEIPADNWGVSGETVTAWRKRARKP